MITGGVIKGFEDALEQVIALAVFIPVLIDSAGNIGTQSLAISIRGIAVGGFTPEEFRNQIWREALAGFVVGLSCGAMVGLIAFVWQGDMNLALAVMLAMWFGMAFSALVGMLVPLIVHRLKADPALASGPVITTIADITAIYLYFKIASSLLGLLVNAG
jgi:magnesium transporter